MPVIVLVTEIEVSREIVFDLSRNIDFHQNSVLQTKEKAVEGVVEGLIGMGESVTWEATHFGFKQRLTSEIVAMDRPHSFRDSMVSGAFKGFDHDHIFEELSAEKTKMTDVFDYTSPFGIFGCIADTCGLKRYMQALLIQRNHHLKTCAENGSWKRFLQPYNDSVK